MGSETFNGDGLIQEQGFVLGRVAAGSVNLSPHIKATVSFIRVRGLNTKFILMRLLSFMKNIASFIVETRSQRN